MLKISKFSKGVFILSLEDEDLFTDGKADIKLICPKPLKYKFLDENQTYAEKYFKDSFNSINNNLEDVLSGVSTNTLESDPPDDLYEIENYWKFIPSNYLVKFLSMDIYQDKTRIIELTGLSFYVSMKNEKLTVKSDFQFYGINHPMMSWYLGLLNDYTKLKFIKDE